MCAGDLQVTFRRSVRVREVVLKVRSDQTQSESVTQLHTNSNTCFVRTYNMLALLQVFHLVLENQEVLKKILGSLASLQVLVWSQCILWNQLFAF